MTVDLIQFLYTLAEVFLRNYSFQSDFWQGGPIHLQFGEEPFEESKCIGESSSDLVLPLLLQVEEITFIQELTPFCPQFPSLLSLIVGALDVVVGIDGEVLYKGLAMRV